MSTRTNGLQRQVAAGEVALGVLDNAYSPTLVEFYGDLDHPAVREAVETVRAAAVDAGGLGFGPEDAREKAANGYQLLNVGSTTGALQKTVGGWLDAVAES